ncbi:hypothetical protein FACS1894182_05240 [Bacteroidia bacterium]|nr:hypothetical protein FACS1894182_05240 [Bacteroidia bacterium]
MCVFGQNNANHLYWSADKKLTVADFLIQPQSGQAMSSFAQFSIEHQVSGMNFLTKNFNKKVQNFMIPSASWIDTTNNVSQALLYQQTLFDLAEIYTRQFRKALRENRKKIATGLQIVTDLNDSIMSDLAKRRANYSQETNFAADSDSQLQWEEQIKQELLELKDFAYEK